MSKQQDALAILKLYELRRDDQMRAARRWFLTEFKAENAMEVAAMFRSGERASANFRMVTSYWDTAAALVLNDGIDRKMFLDANTEHVVVYAKIADLLPDLREMFREPDFLSNLEQLVLSIPDAGPKIENRKRLLGIWSGKAAENGSGR